LTEIMATFRWAVLAETKSPYQIPGEFVRIASRTVAGKPHPRGAILARKLAHRW